MSLTFSPVLKTGLSLVPGETHELEFRFENSSEYDKNLYCTLRSPEGLLLSRNHFDVLVPAEGISIETLKITIPKDLRVFYSSNFFVLETTDAVLEEDKNFAFFLSCALPWKWSIEKEDKSLSSNGTAYLGTAHVCKADIPLQNENGTLSLFSQLICALDDSTDIRINSQNDCTVYLDGKSISCAAKEHHISLSLHSGVNSLCIKTDSLECAVSAEFVQTTDYVASCINPDYFIDTSK